MRPSGDGPVGRVRAIVFLLGAAAMMTPLASPPLALALGIAIAMTVGNPFGRWTPRLARWLLQSAVVGLGFGMPLGVVLQAGARGLGYTALGIVASLALGLGLGRWLRVDRHVSLLITAGTSICGGSAIAAVGPVIGASANAMSVSLATVFVMNAVALYLFPWVGGLLELTQGQFAVWAAVAIHDTSSVVGAASAYGQRALEGATVLKLTRALWIVPLTVGISLVRRGGEPETGSVPRLPWFIALFVLAAGARAMIPAAEPLFDGVARAARLLLVLTLFLIGAGLTRSSLRVAGWRPLLQGLLLWLLVSGLSLLAVLRWI